MALCLPGACRQKIDLVFVVDSSGSIQAAGEDNWSRILDFIVRIVNTLIIGPDDARVGLIVFSDDAFNELFLRDTTDRVSLLTKILSLRFRDGRTDTAFGLSLLHREQFRIRNGDRPVAPNVAIVITDGESNDNKTRTIPEAQIARRMGATLFSVGITDFVNENELRLISSPPQIEGQNWFRSPDFASLTSTLLGPLTRTVCDFDREYRPLHILGLTSVFACRLLCEPF